MDTLGRTGSTPADQTADAHGGYVETPSYTLRMTSLAVLSTAIRASAHATLWVVIHEAKRRPFHTMRFRSVIGGAGDQGI